MHNAPISYLTHFLCSDASTDSEDEPDLEAMTEEERTEYLQKKAERKAARDAKRREKYGDKYEQIMAKHEKYVRPSFEMVINLIQLNLFTCWLFDWNGAVQSA